MSKKSSQSIILILCSDAGDGVGSPPNALYRCYSTYTLCQRYSSYKQTVSVLQQRVDSVRCRAVLRSISPSRGECAPLCQRGLYTCAVVLAVSGVCAVEGRPQRRPLPMRRVLLPCARVGRRYGRCLWTPILTCLCACVTLSPQIVVP